jgi:membrane-associated phospholipid phosphatase
MHADYHATRTFQLMTVLNEAYAQIRAGQPTNGYGYVVGMPSLHVAMAIILSRFMVKSRLLSWTFLPVNVLMAAATFMLGYHDFVDSAAGVLLAVSVLAVDGLCERRRGTDRVPLRISPARYSARSLCRVFAVSNRSGDRP